jgi:hypothetical protein
VRQSSDALKVSLIVLTLVVLIGAVIAVAVHSELKQGRNPGEASTPYAAAPLSDELETKKPTKWKIGEFKDEFDRPTGNKYVSRVQVFVGSYDNSSTIGGVLYVHLIFNSNGNVTIIMRENGLDTANVKGRYAGKNYIIKVLAGASNVIQYKAEVHGRALVVYGQQPDPRVPVGGLPLTRLLVSARDDVKVHISNPDRLVETYRFDIKQDDLHGLAEALDKIGVCTSPFCQKQSEEISEQLLERAFPHS